MALIDDFVAAVDNTTFKRRVSIAVTRTVMTVAGSGTPTADQKALAKRFMLSPESESERYCLPVAARMNANGIADIGAATDAQIQTAVDAVLTINVALQIA